MFKGRVAGIPVEALYLFRNGRYRSVHPVMDADRPRDGDGRQQPARGHCSGHQHGGRYHIRLCHCWRLCRDLRGPARGTLWLRRHGIGRRLRLHRHRRRAGRRHGDPGRLRLGGPHTDRCDRDRHHRGRAAAARLQPAAAVPHHRPHRSQRHHAAHHWREALVFAHTARSLLSPTSGRSPLWPAPSSFLASWTAVTATSSA